MALKSWGSEGEQMKPGEGHGVARGSGSTILSGFTALFRMQQTFANPKVTRSHFDEFIRTNIFQGEFERHVSGRGEGQCFIRPGGSHVGQVFRLTDIDIQVLISAILADHHPLIEFDPWTDEELAAFLHLKEAIGRTRAMFEGDKGAMGRHGQVLFFDGFIFRKHVMHDDSPASPRQQNIL